MDDYCIGRGGQAAGGFELTLGCKVAASVGRWSGKENKCSDDNVC